VYYITLSASLLFSMKYALRYESLSRETFYSKVKMTGYNTDGYLDGLIIESSNYKDVFQKYKDVLNAVFLVDLPYLCTEVGTYNMSCRLADYLDVLTVLNGSSYVYFTSDKSSIPELCEWIERNNAVVNPFSGAGRRVFNARMNYNSVYTDIMLYRKSNTGKLSA
jgi:hypothetical protein